ncbi:MAG: DUF4435 domain-containing protein [Succinivibrio sp.]|nr:DUF4435 domain-containing protein [Succinivibrio sp.]
MQDDLNFTAEGWQAHSTMLAAPECIMLYVEGADDKVFWQYLVNDLSSKLPRGVNVLTEILDDAAGCAAIIEKLESGDFPDFAAALDGEYDALLHDREDLKARYPNLVYTNRHSIENYLFCPKSLAEVLCLRNRQHGPSLSDQEKVAAEFAEFQREIADRLKELICCECVARLEKMRHPDRVVEPAIGGEYKSISRFCKPNELLPDKQELAKRTCKLLPAGNSDFISLKERFDALPHPENLLNFHFINDAVLRFVKKHNRSGEQFGTNELCELLFGKCSECREQCADFKVLKDDLARALLFVHYMLINNQPVSEAQPTPGTSDN